MKIEIPESVMVTIHGLISRGIQAVEVSDAEARQGQGEKPDRRGRPDATEQTERMERPGRRVRRGRRETVSRQSSRTTETATSSSGR